MLKQLYLVADRQSAPQPSIECRVYSRLACDVSTSCQPTSAWGRKDSRWPASISDVSQGGLRLIVRRRFEPGSGLGIELPGHDGGEPYTVLAKVVHVRALPDGSWALGCQFISELSEDELQRLLPPQPPARNTSLSAVKLQLEIRPGRVIDCCIPRLSVPGTWPAPAGKTLTMRITTPHGPRPSLRLEVVRCWLQGERWTLQCRLLHPSWEDLIRTLRHPAKPGSNPQ